MRGRVADQVRRRGDVHGGLGHRELDARAVADRAAARGHDDVGLLLGRGRLGSEPWRTTPSHIARSPPRASRTRKTAKRKPMRRSISFTGYPCGASTAPAAGSTGTSGRPRPPDPGGRGVRRGHRLGARRGRVGDRRCRPRAWSPRPARRARRPPLAMIVGGGVARRRHPARGELAVTRARAQVLDRAGRWRDQALVGGRGADPLGGGQTADLGLERRVLSLERADGRHRARDPGVQLQQRDLRGDDPAEQDPDQPDPRAPAQQPVDEAGLGQRAQALERARGPAADGAGRGGRRDGPERAGHAAGAWCCGAGRARRVASPDGGPGRHLVLLPELAGGPQAGRLRTRVVRDLARASPRPSAGRPARPPACGRTRTRADRAGRCSRAPSRRGSASRAGPRANGTRSRRGGRRRRARPRRAAGPRRAGPARR